MTRELKEAIELGVLKEADSLEKIKRILDPSKNLEETPLEYFMIKVIELGTILKPY